jgi:hypothetical protein
MRSTYSGATVRLYALSDSDPVAQTLFYGPLAEAITHARQQPDSVQDTLWLATDNDVIAWRDFEPD